MTKFCMKALMYLSLWMRALKASPFLQLVEKFWISTPGYLFNNKLKKNNHLMSWQIYSTYNFYNSFSVLQKWCYLTMQCKPYPRVILWHQRSNASFADFFSCDISSWNQAKTLLHDRKLWQVPVTASILLKIRSSYW